MEPDALSTASPVGRELYNAICRALRAIGPFEQEVKKTSIHLVRGSAFAGVHLRKQHVIVTIKAAQAVRSPRIAKAEQVSKNRWHLDVKIATPAEIDEELLGWLREAYALCA